ncbi:ABC transporter permease [bacterium]|nr:MAG: ABC transporter permease [bacterium]
MNGRILALIAGCVLILLGALLVSGVGPVTALTALLKGSLGTANGITKSLENTTPLLLAGVAVFLALRAGLFNIGAEGQFLVGALACTTVALRVPGTGGILMGTAAAVAAGALWAWPAGAIKAYRGGHEVITTIMLNNVAGLLTGYLVSGPMRAPGGDTTTASVTEATRLPNMVNTPSFSINLALPFAVLLAVGLAWWLRRTVSGYELRVTGANPTAALYAGIDPRKTAVRAMLASGAVAGLAGAVQVLAFEGRFYTGFSPGYGFDALGVALLAGESALALIPAAFLFGALAKGALALQFEGVPKGITTVVLALLILIAAALRARGVKKVA